MTVAYDDRWSYRVGSKGFHNKLHAIEENSRTGNPVLFVAPAPYRSCDFSKEPREDLMVLLAEQAHRIREQNNKIRLYYSGGADSDLMLRAFLLNGIHVDEIVCWKCGIPPADFEIDQYAIPRLKSLDLPHTKVTVSAPTLDDYVSFYSEGVTKDRIDSGLYNFNTHIRIIEQLEQFKDENKQPGVANLRGMDRPKVLQHHGDWYTYLFDVDLEPNAHTINFFSDDPVIQCKQAHLYTKGETSMCRDIDERKFPEKKLLSDNDCFILFKGKVVRYANEKEKIALEYLLEKKPKIIDLWCQNMEVLKKLDIGNWWNKGHPELSTVGVFSEFFCLNKKQTKTVDELYPNGFKNQ